MKHIYSSTVVLFILLFATTPSKANSISTLYKALSFSSSVQYGGSYSYSSRRGRGDDDDDHHYGDDDDDGGNDIPLDGGLSFLAVAGAGLGIKKVVEHRNKKNNEK